ncbi:T9SS C-terminal target domain-containing protein [Chryseobacterium sp. 3008163]|nr:T9SS C-terminal target domain-containing protein [Chryseobacterium sp. 3008163]
MKKFTGLRVAVLSTFLTIGVYHAQIVKGSKNAEFKEKSFGDTSNPSGYERCSTVDYENFLRESFPGRMTTEQFESWLAPLVKNAKANKSQSGNIVTIPVVVHVIHSGQAYGVAQNIVDEQVMSQITVMNNDFRRLTGTPGFNSNVVGADTQIQFALAKVDPNGNPTNGIDRVNLCQASWTRQQVEQFVKPETSWDTTQYMNMWSVNFPSNSSILGYAQFPDSNLAGLDPVGGDYYTDGVVARYGTFGSTDYDVDGTFSMITGYDKGRTMTHEVGHFLGLRHIWGDQACGTDYCTDTPTAHMENYVCNPAIASCDNPAVFEMVENYMDYTNDACMNIFTIDQKARITAVMNNSPRRLELKTSTKDIAIPLFANDAEVKIERECATISCSTVAQSPKISLYNRGTSALTSAVITYTINGNSQTLNWTGNLAQDKYQIVTLPMGASTLGGQLNINVTSVNGTADQRSSNSNLTVNYLGAPARVDANVVFNLQLDPYGAEVSWNLKNSSGVTVYSGSAYPSTNTSLPALQTFNWTLNPLECYTFTINDGFGDGIYQWGGYYNIKTQSGATLITGSHYSLTQTRLLKAQVLGTNEVIKETFALYPNPADDILNITKVSNKAKYEIHNAVGQIVKAGEINNNQVRVAELVKGTYIITINDRDISESIKFIKK